MANLTPADSFDAVYQTISTDPVSSTLFNSIHQALLNCAQWLKTRAVPVGGIIMYHGSLSSLSSHWQICDGTNGTPDLRGQFVVGASASGGYSAGTTGGSADAIIPNHTHDYWKLHYFDVEPPLNVPYGSSTIAWLADVGHTTANASDGESVTNKNLPPYYAAYYIMRIS